MDKLSEQFSLIYDEYIEKIYRFVYLKVSDREIAEDISSKVFLKAWEAYKNPKTEVKNPGAFLYQIARNAVVDHYRAKGRDHIVSFEDRPEIASSVVNAQNKAILSADIDVVKGAIFKLKKDHQDVIIWHYLEDMPIGKIAELMGKPEGTVRVMLHRGLKELKGLVKES